MKTRMEMMIPTLPRQKMTQRFEEPRAVRGARHVASSICRRSTSLPSAVSRIEQIAPKQWLMSQWFWHYWFHLLQRTAALEKAGLLPAWHQQPLLSPSRVRYEKSCKWILWVLENIIDLKTKTEAFAPVLRGAESREWSGGERHWHLRSAEPKTIKMIQQLRKMKNRLTSRNCTTSWIKANEKNVTKYLNVHSDSPIVRGPPKHRTLFRVGGTSRTAPSAVSATNLPWTILRREDMMRLANYWEAG